MGFSFVNSAKSEYDYNSSPQATSSTLNIASGDVLVAWVGYEDDRVSNCTITDGASNTFEVEQETANEDNGPRGRFGVILNAIANSSATFTVTVGTAPYCGLIILQFRPDAGETVSVDVKDEEIGKWGSVLTGGVISTSGIDEIVVAGAKNYYSADFGNPTIGGESASIVQFSGCWNAAIYRILTSAESNIYAQVDHDNAFYVMNTIAIKSVQSSTPIPVFLNQYRQRRN